MDEVTRSGGSAAPSTALLLRGFHCKSWCRLIQG
jgi:hypothetical protein